MVKALESNCDSDGIVQISIKKIAAHADIGLDTARKYLRLMVNDGTLSLVNTSNGPRARTYKILGKQLQLIEDKTSPELPMSLVDRIQSRIDELKSLRDENAKLKEENEFLKGVFLKVEECASSLDVV
jgi:predicted transcriptional regulator